MARPYAKTIEELESMSTVFIRPGDAANILHINKYRINCMVKYGIKLPFQIFPTGNRVYIHRQSFIDYVKGGGII